MGLIRWIQWGALGAIATLSLIAGAKPAAAAETIVLRYGFLSLDFPVEDLSILAESGQASLPLQFYLSAAGTTPEDFRQVLNRGIDISPISRQSLRDFLPDTEMLDALPIAEVLLSQLPLEGLLEQSLFSIFTTTVGEAALAELNDALYPTGETEDGVNIQNISTAIVTSALDDGNITLIEVLEAYPEDEIVLDGNRIIEAYGQLSELLGQFGTVDS